MDESPNHKIQIPEPSCIARALVGVVFMLLYNSMILLSIQGFKPLAEAGDKTAIEKLEMNRSFLVLGKIGLGIAALILIFVLLQRLLNHLDYTKQSRNS